MRGSREHTPVAKSSDLLLEALGLQRLARQRRKVDIEEVEEARALAARRLGNVLPDVVHVGAYGSREIIDRCEAIVVADREQQESLLAAVRVGASE